ncbi:MAG TPA: hypothetical protein VHB79_39415 [Polyangiaceae bacterium]|nr:hypothetical protein [Polyangiaceae bacterium]
MKKPLCLALVALTLLGCDQQGEKARHSRSEAVASASQAMSGPSLLTRERLSAALAQLRAKASGKLLRLEIRPTELLLQAEDSSTPGAVVELRYRDGKVSEPEQAVLRGKGQLAENLFDLADVKLDAIPELAREAVRRVDADNGAVELVLIRRALPESDDVRLRVYVASPRQSGYIDADRTGQLL